ncbi:small acid-soluble spore protein P [Cohnella sp. GCM10012308]|uniref:small acid-soluble spore protein P n=1 Tax=Cohnella sp. GCM10012308 TaxID=3317329 RepID=UPI0036114515
MSKPKSQPVPEANPQQERDERSPGHRGGQEPLSGSKKVKNRNHVSHHNPQG